MKFVFTFLVAQVIATASFAAVYEIDPAHSTVGFEVTHLMISTVDGRFDEFKGQLTYDEKKGVLTGISGVTKTASINTNNKKRDDHLKSPDFFNAKKYPELKFEAKNLNVKKGEKKKVKGQLTINGKTNTVPFELDFKGAVKDPMGNEKLVVNADAEIKRKDYNVNWNKALETGGVVVSDEVEIKVRAQAAKKADEKK